jgi:hypothetical protein
MNNEQKENAKEIIGSLLCIILGAIAYWLMFAL